MEAFLIIAFREGLEAFLILGIVLAFLEKQELFHIKKYAWGGFFVGIFCSVVFGILFTIVVDGFESEELQYDISLMVLLIAIVLLTYMVFWIQRNSEAATMRKKIELSSNQKWITLLIVFTAIFREGMETVLFSLALIMGDGATSLKDSFLGIAIGFIVSGVSIWLLFKSTIKLPLKSFFKYTSLLILFIVAGLVSLLIKGMQGNELLPTFVLPLYDSSFLIANDSFIGKTFQVLLGYDAKPSFLQLMGWFGYLALMYLTIKMRKISRV